MRFWHEPLIQFLALGGLIFAAYSAFAPEPEVARDVIVVDAPVVASLEQSFEGAWKRPPTAEERQGLVDDFLIEEVFYREAQKLNLDQDDVVIRRRMRQKMEFLLQDTLAQVEPQEAELRAFFDANAQDYRGSAQISFRQVFLGEAASAGAEAGALLAGLNSTTPPDPGEIGQRTLLPASLDAASVRQIDGVFGTGFGDSLAALPQGQWAGPVQSGFGLHLIEVTQVTPAPETTFETARQAVLRDYQYEQQRNATEAVVARLKQQYDIRILEAQP